MNSLRLAMGMAIIAILFIPMAAVDAQSNDSAQKKALRFHKNHPTIDTHVDYKAKHVLKPHHFLNKGRRQVNLPSMEDGHHDAVFFSAFTRQQRLNRENYRAAYKTVIEKIMALRKTTSREMNFDRIEMAFDSDDVYRIFAKKKKIAIASVENAFPIGEDLGRIDELYSLGVRLISLTHNGANQLADSSRPPRGRVTPAEMHGGLSSLGRKVIKKLNDLGIIIDISHVSKKAALEIIRLSKAPVIASHSAVKNFHSHPSNFDNEVLRALKANGGVLHLGAYPFYVGPRSASLNQYLNHFDRMVDAIGINNVGLSSDFGGGGGLRGWNDADETYLVTTELFKRGYSASAIRKIWNANTLRVWKKVESVSRQK